MGKLTNFELDARVPLIVRAPGFKQNVRLRSLVELVDLYPTLAELAGLPLPAHLEGTSFVPLLRDAGRQWKKAAFTQCPREGWMGYSMRTDRYRITRWTKAGETDIIELYDHQSNPAEDKNLAGLPALATVQQELLAQLQAGWRAARPAN